MKNLFSPAWKASLQPRKQRKYRYQAPLHLRQKFMHVHLSPLLRQKYGFRSFPLRTGDKVKVLRGQFRKKENKVERLSLKKERVFITGLERIKKDGTKLLVPFSPSSLMLIELNLDDKKRKQKLESKTAKKNSKEKAEKKTEA